MGAKGCSIGPDSLPLRVRATWVCTHAQLRRGRRSQHVPARDFVTEHAEHTPATTHAQTTKVESILQAAIGQLDSGTRRVTLLVHRGRLFHATPRKPTLLVGEFQSELTITCILDRTLLAKRTLTARRSGHLDSRPSRRLVARTTSAGDPRGRCRWRRCAASHPKSSTVIASVSASGARPGTGPTKSTPRAAAACTFSSPV